MFAARRTKVLVCPLPGVPTLAITLTFKLRYAWEDFPQCVIYNSGGLPAPPFNITVPPS